MSPRASGRRRCIHIALLATISVATTFRPASAQGPPNDFRIGRFIGDGLASAAASMQQAREHKTAWTRDIAVARERFWAAYPSGAGLAAAEQRFANLLWQKDLYALYIAAANRISYGSAPGGVADVLERLTGGSVDGGVTPVAKSLFDSWVNAVLESSAVSVAGNKFVTAEAIASERSAVAYTRYQRVRDYYELMRSPHSPLHSADPSTYLGAVFVQAHGLLSPSDGRRQVEAMEKALGTGNVRAAAAAVRVRTAQSRELAADPLGHVVSAAIEAQRARLEDRVAVLVTIAAGTVPRYDWVTTNILYQDLVSRFTASRLHALHQRLIKLPRFFPCGPVRGGSTCYHAVLDQGEDAFFASVEREDANRASQAAYEASFTNPTSDFVKTSDYWRGMANRGSHTLFRRTAFIYRGHWRANATASLDARVRGAMEQLELHIDKHIALEESQWGRPKTAQDNAAFPPLYTAMDGQVAVVRQACERAGADSEPCVLLAIAEQTVSALRHRR